MAKLASMSVLLLIATLVVMAPSGKILETEAATPPRKLLEIDPQEVEMLIKLPTNAMSSKIGVPRGGYCTPLKLCDLGCICLYPRAIPPTGVCVGNC